MPAGSTTVDVDAGAATASQELDLGGGATYTVVIRDLEGGVGVLPIQDFAAANQIPSGGVEAGLGGSATDLSAGSWVLAGLTLAVAWFARRAVMRTPRTEIPE